MLAYYLWFRCILWVDDMAIWKFMWYSAVMFYIEIFYACLVGELIEDVTSIS